MNFTPQDKDEIDFFLGHFPVTVLVVSEDGDLRDLGERSNGLEAEKDRSLLVDKVQRSPVKSRNTSRKPARGEQGGGTYGAHANTENTKRPARPAVMNGTKYQGMHCRSSPKAGACERRSTRSNALYTKCAHRTFANRLSCDHACLMRGELKEDKKVPLKVNIVGEEAVKDDMEGQASVVKSYSCQQCCYATNNSYSLSCHVRTHTGEKPYVCQGCGRAFRTRSQLNRHRYTCGGIKGKAKRPYPKKWQCKSCKYVSTSTYNLKVHCRIHTGEKPYKCPICKVAFRTSSHLARHKLCHQTKSS